MEQLVCLYDRSSVPRNVVGWFGGFVSTLAQTSCDDSKVWWVATYDGFYLTRGHHSNLISKVCMAQREETTTWEALLVLINYILGSLLRKAKEAGFNVAEIVADRTHTCQPSRVSLDCPLSRDLGICPGVQGFIQGFWDF